MSQCECFNKTRPRLNDVAKTEGGFEWDLSFTLNCVSFLLLHVHVVLCAVVLSGERWRCFSGLKVVSRLPEVICETRRQEYGSM